MAASPFHCQIHNVGSCRLDTAEHCLDPGFAVCHSVKSDMGGKVRGSTQDHSHSQQQQQPASNRVWWYAKLIRRAPNNGREVEMSGGCFASVEQTRVPIKFAGQKESFAGTGN